MSTRKTLDQQITLALAAALKSKSSLIRISDLPTPWRYNLHIIYGYRFTESRTHCMRSIFRLHNESFNIWSHILGCVFLFSVLMYGGPPVPTSDINIDEDGNNAATGLLTSVYYAYLLAAILCTTCSVSWHTMRCIASHSTMSCFSSMDLMGVTTLVIASVLVTQFIAFVDSPFWQHSYMGASLTLGATALTACWLPIMCRPENSWTRVLVWAALAVQGLAMPVVHLLWSRGLQRTIEIYGLIVPAYGPIGLGAIIYATKFPECCWPGRFDYLGASHNILHVASLWAIWLGIDALRNPYRTVGVGS
jgi:adiponectin receptor